MKIIDTTEANMLRQAFINAFVDTSTDYYKNISKIEPDTVVYGAYYFSYLWDTLYQDNTETISFDNAIKLIVQKNQVYSMWDIRPKEIVDPFPYPPLKPHYLDIYNSDTIIKWESAELTALLDKELGDYSTYDCLTATLPEDIYIFDDTFEWSVLFTHSAIDGERICVSTKSNQKL